MYRDLYEALLGAIVCIAAIFAAGFLGRRFIDWRDGFTGFESIDWKAEFESIKAPDSPAALDAAGPAPTGSTEVFFVPAEWVERYRAEGHSRRARHAAA